MHHTSGLNIRPHNQQIRCYIVCHMQIVLACGVFRNLADLRFAALSSSSKHALRLISDACSLPSPRLTSEGDVSSSVPRNTGRGKCMALPLRFSPRLVGIQASAWLCCAGNTSTSKYCMTPSTIAMLSKNPLTETRSIRFVVALYSVRSTVFSSVDTSPLTASVEALPLETGPSDDALLLAALWSPKETSEKVRRTSGESSVSTSNARSAADANLWVGSGIEMTLRID